MVHAGAKLCPIYACMPWLKEKVPTMELSLVILKNVGVLILAAKIEGGDCALRDKLV